MLKSPPAKEGRSRHEGISRGKQRGGEEKERGIGGKGKRERG